MSLAKAFLGRRLASFEAEDVKIGATRGVPVLGLDALASAAYGPEAALAILIPLGAAGLVYMQPLTVVILLLLAILYLSYRQTIAAYPNGGGSYVVAKENLGTLPGLCAASALVLDYVLNAAVGISAGVGALVSAFPALHGHILALCLGILVVIALVNLRGVRESGLAFGIPTYAFVVLFGVILLIGIAKTIAADGHPVPVVPPPPLAAAGAAAGLWLLLRAFASGCTAMTGVEAVSNGVPLFKEPAVKHAKRTLAAICAILAALLGGIAYLTHAYRIGAMKQELAGYPARASSSLIAAVVGRFIAVAKFHDGAWITVVLMPALLLLFYSVRRHYRKVEHQTARDTPIELDAGPAPVAVVIPVKSWDNLTEKALRFGLTLSADVTAVHVYSDNAECEKLREAWSRYVEAPMAAAGLHPTPLVCISSPYRRLFTPLLDFLDRFRKERSGMIAVILPDLVEARWWEYLLHTQRANVLRSLLLLKGNQRVAVISVPWYLERRRPGRETVSA